MEKMEITVDLLLELLTKLAIIEQHDALVQAKVEIMSKLTGEPAPVCHCPHCLMPELSLKLNKEIEAQLPEGKFLDDLASKELVDKIDHGLQTYRDERSQDQEMDQLAQLDKNPGTVN